LDVVSASVPNILRLIRRNACLHKCSVQPIVTDLSSLELVGGVECGEAPRLN
jgi:hypothetical protein